MLVNMYWVYLRHTITNTDFEKTYEEFQVDRTWWRKM